MIVDKHVYKNMCAFLGGLRPHISLGQAHMGPYGFFLARKIKRIHEKIVVNYCLHFGAFCEALGIIKVMKSVQPSANSRFWLVEDGDAF